MTSIFCKCLLFGIGYQRRPVEKRQTIVTLDTKYMGTDCVVLKYGRRICGTGGCLANSPLVQSKAYFEVQIRSAGVWGLGVATRNCNLDTPPLGTDATSWIYNSNGKIVHNNIAQYNNLKIPAEGDVVSCSYDHFELNYYINGKSISAPVTGFKGTMYPVIYVDKGAIIDVNFSENFQYPPPQGFEGVMMEHSII